MHYRLYFIFILVFVLFSCERDKNDNFPDPDFLAESELLVRFSSDEIKQMINNQDEFSSFASIFVRYNVSVYKVIYKTIDTENNPVLASGALIVPELENPAPLLSFQHGTIKKDENAPSNFKSDDYFIAVFFSSTGFIISLPDYLGYGSSKHLTHPYEHGNSLASASRDMLRAVREFDDREKSFRINDKLFLSGYSEGGYATMALMKLLEEKHSREFRITAATVGAGAYNKSMFANHILDLNSELSYLNEFLWVLDTYNTVYKLNRPYNQYFNEPYAGIIENGGVFANTQLNPQLLFSNAFREGILNGSDTQFKNVLADNDNYNWEPKAPLQMYHGTNDDYVFYFNSSSAYEAMTNKGATSVELITVPNGDHFSTLQSYFTGTFTFFNKF